MAEEKRLSPPYGVFSTFKSSLERLAQGVPNQIDRSVFPGMAWNAQNQLMIGLRFLGLIDENGKPTQTLHKLAVADESKRKAHLDAIVRERYAPLFATDLMKTTPALLDQHVTEIYGVNGDTREKAVRFFLSVLAYLEIPVSPLFSKARSNSSGSGTTRRRRVTRPRPVEGSEEEDEQDEEEQPQSGESRSVALKSGGTLTLSASTKFVALSASDRKFVFDLFDQLAAYESREADATV
jgi:hypothetical protein